jgi:hypothetical protein
VRFAAAPSAASSGDTVPVHVLIEHYFNFGPFAVISDREDGPSEESEDPIEDSTY